MTWPNHQLRDVSDRIDYGVSESAVDLPVGPKFLRITDIQDDTVNWDAVPFCGGEERKFRSVRLQHGDIVFARTGATTGKSFLVRDCPANAVFASYLIRVRANSSLFPSYLAHFFRSLEYWKQISAKAVGAAQPGINASKLGELIIPVPPLAEQKRIAAILDAADALRAKRRESLHQLDALQKSIFLDMFGDPVTNPKGWPANQCLGDIADIVSGITKGRKVGNQFVREVPYLAVANVQDRELRLGSVKMIEATENEISRYALLKDDLLLTEGGDPDKLGRGSLWNEELPTCIHQNHVFRVRVTSKDILPRYLNWLVGSERGKKYFFMSAKQTTGIASINMTQLKRFPMLMPPRSLQLEFGKRIEKIEYTIKSVIAAQAGADSLFLSLQQRAFRGEL